MLKAEEPALQFCDRLRQGAKLSWLAKRTPEVVEGPPPFPADWYLPEKLGVDPADAAVGFVPDPFEVPGGGWIAAVVSDVDWINNGIKMFGFAIPCPIKVFPNAELESARAWIVEAS